MQRKMLFMVVLATGWILLTQIGAEEGLHQTTAACLAAPPLSEPCVENCRTCHAIDPADNAVLPLYIYKDGDALLCGTCHPDNVYASAATALPAIGEQNHPSAVFYQPEEQPHKLELNPIGPRLFVDEGGGNPKIHCSTCHDTMRGAHKLLRLDDPALCLACHRK